MDGSVSGNDELVGALSSALEAEDPSTRMKAAMAAGTNADPGLCSVLIARCAVEPDFFVRDTLTWALTRLPAQVTVPALRGALDTGSSQARSQALHTLSKIGDPETWALITEAMLTSDDDEVACSAWRAAVVLVPERERRLLAEVLATQLGRGDRDMQRSLSRALVAVGDVIVSVVPTRETHAAPEVRAHAHATLVLLRDPEAGFGALLDEAQRITALGP